MLRGLPAGLDQAGIPAVMIVREVLRGRALHRDLRCGLLVLLGHNRKGFIVFYSILEFFLESCIFFPASLGSQAVHWTSASRFWGTGEV